MMALSSLSRSSMASRSSSRWGAAGIETVVIGSPHGSKVAIVEVHDDEEFFALVIPPLGWACDGRTDILGSVLGDTCDAASLVKGYPVLVELEVGGVEDEPW